MPFANTVHIGALMMLAPTATARGGGDGGGLGGGSGGGGGDRDGDRSGGGDGSKGEGNADVGDASSRSVKNKTTKVMATAANTVAIPISTISRVGR